MKASVAARLLHHQERKERKGRKTGKDVQIPITEGARSMLEPWYDALFNSTKEFTGPDGPRTAESVWFEALGDALALTASEKFSEGGSGGLDISAGPQCDEINEDVARCVISLLEREGITL